MSLDDLHAALELVGRQGDGAHFVGERPPEFIAKAEEALGLTFPPSYRAFVSELGAGDVTGQEFYGVTEDRFEAATIPNGIWLTLQEREDCGLPETIVIVSETGDGAYYALDLEAAGQDGEAPVVLWRPHVSQPDDDREPVARSFGEFFRRQIEAALSRA